MEKNAPRTLFAMKAAFVRDGDQQRTSGIWGGSTKKPLVPERKNVG